MRQRVGVCCLWSVKAGKSRKRDPWFYLTQSRDSNGEIIFIWSKYSLLRCLPKSVFFLEKVLSNAPASRCLLSLKRHCMPASLRLVLFDTISWFKRWNYLAIQRKNRKKNLPCSTVVQTDGCWKQTGDQVVWMVVRFYRTWPRRSKKSMIVFTKRVTKSFERMSVFTEQVTKSFERMSVYTKRVSKSFERLDVSTERVIKPFERMQTFFERVTQVVRTDANFLRTTSKRLVNGILFENGKSLVYVFPWKVTNVLQIIPDFYYYNPLGGVLTAIANVRLT